MTNNHPTPKHVAKHIKDCPTCGANTIKAEFDKTNEWPVKMGQSFIQENVDVEKGTWKFNTFVCSSCHSQFMDVVKK